MKTKAPRAIAVIGAVALIVFAFALGYYTALPAGSHAAAASEVSRAVGSALAKPNELERAADLAPILASLDAQNLDAVVGAYEATFTSVGPGAVAMEMLAEAWSKIDPAGAFQRIGGWDLYWRTMALPFLARSWARRDVASARAAVETLKPGGLRDAASNAVIHGWADSRDPAIWDGYVAGLPFGSQAAYNLMQRIAAREGVEALLQRAESVPADAADGFRPLALRQALDIAAQIDPERAAAFAERLSGSVEGGLEGVVARRWAASDGPRATEWALLRPAGSVRDGALHAALNAWLQSDEQAALDWARSQPDEVVAPVLDLYANALGKSDPKRALELSAGIADPTERQRTQALLARNWLARQPEIAAAWLEQNDLADLVAQSQRTPKRERGPAAPLGQPAGGKGD